MKNFSAISVRETDLCQEIEKLTDKNISVVLDPVFLLSKEEWSKYCVPINRSKYILYYNLLPSKEADGFVKTLSAKLKTEIVEITGSVSMKKVGRRYMQTVDAFEFISYIKNAEIVVTSSFHGVVFSIMFGKKFYAVGMGNKVERVKSLLSALNIEECLVAEKYYSNIDFDKMRSKVNQSLEILKGLDGSYDMIFMDAAKAQYIYYLPEVIRLLKTGGLLISDNILQDGDVAQSRYAVTRRNRTIHSRMREYLYTLKHEKELQTAIIPIGDGVAVSTKKGTL